MDVGRHPNIRLITNSELIELKGKAGDFKAKVLRRARFIDETECTACGECAAVCPVDCCVPDEDRVESEEELLAKQRFMHPE